MKIIVLLLLVSCDVRAHVAGSLVGQKRHLSAADGFLSQKHHTIEEVIDKTYSVVHKEPTRIAVASQCGGKFYQCGEGKFTKSYANHRAYALKHGYEYFLLQSPMSGRIQPWDRYPLVSHLHERGAE